MRNQPKELEQEVLLQGVGANDVVERIDNKHRRLNGIEQKICSTCKQWYPMSEYSGRKSSPDAKSYSCKTCERATAMRSYQRALETKPAKQTYQENREKARERARRYYEKNKEQILEEHKIYRRENMDVWHKSDKKRRKRLAKAEKDGVTREQIIERDSSIVDGKRVPICQICFQPIWDAAEIEVDHIKPINRGGSDTADNKRTTHATCNRMRPKDGSDLKEVKHGESVRVQSKETT